MPYSRCWDDDNVHKHTARHADPVEAVEPAIYLSFFGGVLKVVEGNRLKEAGWEDGTV